MCGIVGRFAWSQPLSAAGVEGVVDHLRHRGPDERGFWADERFALGHRRLSIIDLSSGQQPMATEDGGLVVTFNGEISTTPSCGASRGRGYRFRTSSDTEVLLTASASGRRPAAAAAGHVPFAAGAAGGCFSPATASAKPLYYVDTPGTVTFASGCARSSLSASRTAGSA
jgi:asparagine synthase (glutamine-hydrolysing)